MDELKPCWCGVPAKQKRNGIVVCSLVSRHGYAYDAEEWNRRPNFGEFERLTEQRDIWIREAFRQRTSRKRALKDARKWLAGCHLLDYSDHCRAPSTPLAAAPQLLEACKALLTVLDVGGQPRKLEEALTWRQNDEKARRLAIEAIAAAEGRA